MNLSIRLRNDNSPAFYSVLKETIQNPLLQDESLDSELLDSPALVEIKFFDINMEYEKFGNLLMRHRLRLKIKDIEILDHITTSSFQKFMAGVVPDSNERPRETNRDMLKFEFSQCDSKESSNSSPEHNIKVKNHEYF